jgi:hypothetical protein
MTETITYSLLLQFVWYCRKNDFLLHGISVCNDKKPCSLLLWNAVEQLFKKTQFLVNQFVRSLLLSHPVSCFCLQSFQVFVLSRIKETG